MVKRNPRKLGLVLSGGGSRGAYEAGVILYLREKLTKRLGREIRFDVVAGTSVGAINASFLASSADSPSEQGKILCDAWKSLHIESLLGLRDRDVWRASKLLLGRKIESQQKKAYRLGGLIRTDGLEKFVIEHIPWRSIRKNISRGHIDAISVSATHIGTGHSVVFIDQKKPLSKTWSDDPFTRHMRVAISPRHALASAAIPVLFPAVKVQGSFYMDGGIRQNTPMSPAIRLGAEKLIVVTLRNKNTIPKNEAQTKMDEATVSRPLFLLGKTLGSLMLDRTEIDLLRLQRFNSIVQAGRKAFGEDFDTQISQALTDMGRGSLKHVETVHIQPSVNIAEIASDHVRNDKVNVSSRFARKLLDKLAKRTPEKQTDLLSYFLFDGSFAAKLIDQGYKDAESMEEQLVDLIEKE